MWLSEGLADIVMIFSSRIQARRKETSKQTPDHCAMGSIDYGGGGDGGARAESLTTLGSQEFPKSTAKDFGVGRETGSVGDIIEFGTSTIHFSVKPQTHGCTQDQGNVFRSLH